MKREGDFIHLSKQLKDGIFKSQEGATLLIKKVGLTVNILRREVISRTFDCILTLRPEEQGYYEITPEQWFDLQKEGWCINVEFSLENSPVC